MLILAATISFLAALVVGTEHETHIVAVGNQTFNPTSVVARSGDTISFLFQDGNHTATQSTFTSPCTALQGGADSGPMPATGAVATPTFNYTVADDKPVWFFCATGAHCKSGMVFAVNPTAKETFATFQAAAKGCDPAAKDCVGGEFFPIPNPPPYTFNPLFGDPTWDDPFWLHNSNYNSGYRYGDGGGLGVRALAGALIIGTLAAI